MVGLGGVALAVKPTCGCGRSLLPVPPVGTNMLLTIGFAARHYLGRLLVLQENRTVQQRLALLGWALLQLKPIEVLGCDALMHR